MSVMFRNVRDGLEDFTRWANDPNPRLGLGLPEIDSLMRGGLAKAECMMVLAYSSVGKTWLALQALAANPHVPTVFFSLEMSWRQVASRLTAITTGTPTWELEKAAKTLEYVPQIEDTARRFPFLVGNDQSELSIKDMKQIVTDAGRHFGQPIRLVVVDYLELIGGAGMLGKSEQVDKAAQKIRALAKDTDTSVIVLHQVSKTDGSGGHQPLSLDAGKYGGHHPMDAVLGAYRPALEKGLGHIDRERLRPELWLQVLKNRNGQPHEEGIRHRISTIGQITPWSEPPQAASPGFQANLLEQVPEPSYFDEEEPF